MPEPTKPNLGSDQNPAATAAASTGATESAPEQDNAGTKPEEKVEATSKPKQEQLKTWTKDKLLVSCFLHDTYLLFT